MKLYIDNQFIIDSIELSGIEQALNNWIISRPNQVIYGYEMGSFRAEDQWIEAIVEYVTSDETINLLIKSEVDMKIELKESTLQYCKQIDDNLPPVIEKLYGMQPESEENQLAYLFEGLSFLVSSFSHLNLNFEIDERIEGMKELKNLFDQKDYVELADLITYDWLPWIKENQSALVALHIGM